jgi:hypothetical protein
MPNGDVKLFDATLGFEFALQDVTQADQVPRVHRRVGQHLVAQRPLAPIGFLELLVQLHAEVLPQVGGQAELRFVQQFHAHHGVEHVRRAEAVHLLQHAQVVVGIMDHPFDGTIRQRLAQRVHVVDHQGIDEPGLRARAHLDQADALLVPVEAARLGVQREDGLGAQFRHQPRQGGRRGDELVRRFHGARKDVG